MLRPRPPYFSAKGTTGQGYSDYYNAQFGNGLTVYRGRPFQNGHGFGGALLGLMRSATPLLKNMGKTLLRAGVGVAEDLMDGQSFKTSVKSRGIGALKNLAGGIMSGPKQKAAPKRAGTKRKRKISSSSSQTGSGRHPKRRRKDIFDD